MVFKTLIDPDRVADHLDDPDWRIIDCRFDLADPAAGRREWQAGHIPGAVYADLDTVLSGPVTVDSGRHPLPAVTQLTDWLSRHGVGPGTQVVAYDASGGAFAARCWWLLRWLGHEAVAVLDGGWSAWQAAGLPVSDAPVHPTAREFVARPQADWVVPHADVLAISNDTVPGCIVDARDPERYRGEVEPIDPVAGHVPGALNIPFKQNLDATGRFLSPERLRERFATAEASADGDAVVHMCGSGVTACHNILAMEHAGLHNSRLYAESWSGWIRDARHPVARGESSFAARGAPLR